MDKVTRNEPVVLAIDAGTGSARVIAYNLAGDEVAKASREWTHESVGRYPGGTNFDTKNGWSLLASACREVMLELARTQCRVLAVTPSSMREGFVLYDSSGVEVFACPNTDGRAREEAEELRLSGDADKIFERAGDWVSITAPARFRWLAKYERDIFEKIRKVSMLSDWIAYRLTGIFSTDPTCGSSSALFDLEQRTWSEELIQMTGVPSSAFPDVYESGTPIGRVTFDAAHDTGIPEGTPVTAGGADTQLALHGLGATSKHATVVAGTFWQTTAITSTPSIDPERRLRTLCHVRPDQWMVEGVGFLSGLAYRWYRDSFFVDSSIGFAEMDEMAGSAPPGCDGMIAILSNIMQADSWTHAAPGFLGFDINRPSGHGHFIRSIQEAAAYVVRGHLEILHAVVGDSLSTEELLLAGGTSSAREWPLIISAVSKSRLHRTVRPEATSYGAARLAFKAAGLEMVVHDDWMPITADMTLKDEYDRLYVRWRRAYKAQLEATSGSGMAPLFDPPGAAHRALERS